MNWKLKFIMLCINGVSACNGNWENFNCPSRYRCCTFNFNHSCAQFLFISISISIFWKIESYQKIFWVRFWDQKINYLSHSQMYLLICIFTDNIFGFCIRLKTNSIQKFTQIHLEYEKIIQSILVWWHFVISWKVSIKLSNNLTAITFVANKYIISRSI